MTTSTVEQRAVANAIPVTHHRTKKIKGLNIFYREAGPTDAPLVSLLHGFPTSSHMIRNLIPTLADLYEVGLKEIWGEASVVEGDQEVIKKLKPDGYGARVEQALVFTVSAWDSNCPQHIPQRLEAAEVKVMLAERDQRVEELTKELDQLRKLRTVSP
jgi:hypothetical protein